jgi:hypothetical protein
MPVVKVVVLWLKQIVTVHSVAYADNALEAELENTWNHTHVPEVLGVLLLGGSAHPRSNLPRAVCERLTENVSPFPNEIKCLPEHGKLTHH